MQVNRGHQREEMRGSYNLNNYRRDRYSNVTGIKQKRNENADSFGG